MAASFLARCSATSRPNGLARRLPEVLTSTLAAPSTKLSLGPAACLGSIREKKHKPFHNMYRANRMKEIRKKQQEAAEAEALESLDGSAALNVVQREEPKVGTTPFQAARLMRAFDVFPEKGSTVTFWTRLNVDLSRESVRGTCHLPHGLKSDIRVLAFCPDDEVEEMLAAGADYAGITEPLRRIGTGWLGFDRCLATPNIMPQVMKVARVLGPKRMMPNPRSGTVVTNLKGAIQEAKGGTLLEYRAESEGEVRAIIADANFSDAQVLENLKFFVQTLLCARPRGSSAGGGAPGAAAGGAKALIPGAPATAAGGDTQDSYFLEAGIQLGTDGPLVRMDTESIMPASVGYFR